MNLQERINNVILPSLVVKCDLFDEKLEKYGIYPNAEDSFIISGEFVKRSLSKISATEEREIALGSKMIGSYRDKGSVTSIVDGIIYKLQCDFILQNDNEVTNFCNFLDCLNKKYEINGTTVTFEPDVIAGTSTSRDNVNALLIDGLTELDCIIDDTEITMTTEGMKDIKIEDLASVRQRDFRLYIVDIKVPTKIVEELGTHLVIFENYFWQPNHDNATYISEKYVNCLYHQAVDGFQVYAPNLYNAIKRSTNKQSILEDMLCLGLDYKYDEKLEVINPDDILDNLIID